MSKESIDSPSMLEAVFKPLNEYTHNVYATKGNSNKLTLIKIGVAHVNNQGDLELFINPKHATDNMLIYKKTLRRSKSI